MRLHRERESQKMYDTLGKALEMLPKLVNPGAQSAVVCRASAVDERSASATKRRALMSSSEVHGFSGGIVLVRLRLRRGWARGGAKSVYSHTHTMVARQRRRGPA